MAEPSTFFAGRLRELREAAGLSQYALAQRAGLSKQGMSNLEMGTREPGWVTVQRIAVALGVSSEAFMDPEIARLVQNREPRRPRNSPDLAAAEPTHSHVRRRRGRPAQSVE